MFGIFLLGTRWEADLWKYDWRIVVFGAPVLVAALFTLLWRGASRRNHVMAGAFAVLAVVLFVVPAWGRGSGVLALSRAVSMRRRAHGSALFR